MEMVLSSGFCEIEKEELVSLDGGQEWYEWVGDIGGAACAAMAVVVFWPASTIAVGWGVAATAGAALWGAVKGS